MAVAAPLQPCAHSAQCIGGTKCKEGTCQCHCGKYLYYGRCVDRTVGWPGAEGGGRAIEGRAAASSGRTRGSGTPWWTLTGSSSSARPGRTAARRPAPPTPTADPPASTRAASAAPCPVPTSLTLLAPLTSTRPLYRPPPPLSSLLEGEEELYFARTGRNIFTVN